MASPAGSAYEHRVSMGRHNSWFPIQSVKYWNTVLLGLCCRMVYPIGFRVRVWGVGCTLCCKALVMSEADVTLLLFIISQFNELPFRGQQFITVIPTHSNNDCLRLESSSLWQVASCPPPVAHSMLQNQAIDPDDFDAMSVNFLVKPGCGCCRDGVFSLPYI